MQSQEAAAIAKRNIARPVPCQGETQGKVPMIYEKGEVDNAAFPVLTLPMTEMAGCAASCWPLFGSLCLGCRLRTKILKFIFTHLHMSSKPTMSLHLSHRLLVRIRLPRHVVCNTPAFLWPRSHPVLGKLSLRLWALHVSKPHIFQTLMLHMVWGCTYDRYAVPRPFLSASRQPICAADSFHAPPSL